MTNPTATLSTDDTQITLTLGREDYELILIALAHAKHTAQAANVPTRAESYEVLRLGLRDAERAAWEARANGNDGVRERERLGKVTSEYVAQTIAHRTDGPVTSYVLVHRAMELCAAGTPASVAAEGLMTALDDEGWWIEGNAGSNGS